MKSHWDTVLSLWWVGKCSQTFIWPWWKLYFFYYYWNHLNYEMPAHLCSKETNTPTPTPTLILSSHFYTLGKLLHANPWLNVFYSAFFHPGMLLLHWQRIWDHCHDKKWSCCQPDDFQMVFAWWSKLWKNCFHNAINFDNISQPLAKMAPTVTEPPAITLLHL